MPRTNSRKSLRMMLRPSTSQRTSVSWVAPLLPGVRWLTQHSGVGHLASRSTSGPLARATLPRELASWLRHEGSHPGGGWAPPPLHNSLRALRLAQHSSLRRAASRSTLPPRTPGGSPTALPDGRLRRPTTCQRGLMPATALAPLLLPLTEYVLDCLGRGLRVYHALMRASAPRESHPEHCPWVTVNKASQTRREVAGSDRGGRPTTFAADAFRCTQDRRPSPESARRARRLLPLSLPHCAALCFVFAAVVAFVGKVIVVTLSTCLAWLALFSLVVPTTPINVPVAFALPLEYPTFWTSRSNPRPTGVLGRKRTEPPEVYVPRLTAQVLKAFRPPEVNAQRPEAFQDAVEHMHRARVRNSKARGHGLLCKSTPSSAIIHEDNWHYVRVH